MAALNEVPVLLEELLLCAVALEHLLRAPPVLPVPEPHIDYEQREHQRDEQQGLPEPSIGRELRRKGEEREQSLDDSKGRPGVHPRRDDCNDPCVYGTAERQSEERDEGLGHLCTRLRKRARSYASDFEPAGNLFQRPTEQAYHKREIEATVRSACWNVPQRVSIHAVASVSRTCVPTEACSGPLGADGEPKRSFSPSPASGLLHASLHRHRTRDSH